jgi:hypothetical protein
MTSSEEELAGKLRTYLDQAAAELRPGLAYRLQQARAQALGRLAENAQSAPSGQLAGARGLVGAGAAGGYLKTGDDRPVLSPARLWVAAGLLALAILGWQQWMAWQELAEVEDLDAQILTSDLPIDALVDRGFHLFLQIAPRLATPEDPPAAEGAATGEKAEASTAPAPAGAATKPAE